MLRNWPDLNWLDNWVDGYPDAADRLQAVRRDLDRLADRIEALEVTINDFFVIADGHVQLVGCGCPEGAPWCTKTAIEKLLRPLLNTPNTAEARPAYDPIDDVREHVRHCDSCRRKIATAGGSS